MKDNRVKFLTLGCKVNQYETEAVSELFENEGFAIVDKNEVADVYVINTCTVTSLSDSKSRQFIRKSKKENPNSSVVVMGCYSQVSPEEVEAIEGVDIILGTSERNKIVDLTKEYQQNKKKINIVRDIHKDSDFQPINIERLKGMTRAYIKVQDGCNQYCSYCIIPYARGNVRSRSPIDVKAEVEKLCFNGFQEVVITGIHVASYGKDLKNFKLIDLLEFIHDVEGLERIRLSSMEQSLIDEDFMSRVSKLHKFCDHFHLSLQSGSDTVLKRMNRRYTSNEYLDKVNLIRKYYPRAGITTDIIVGFPGETEEEFQETLEFAKTVGFSKVHVFKYSKRSGTPAANRTDQVKEEIKSERSKLLIDLTDNLRYNYNNSFMNENVEILAEKENNGVFSGHTKSYMEVVVKSDRNIKNQLVNVKVIDVSDEGLIGSLS